MNSLILVKRLDISKTDVTNIDALGTLRGLKDLSLPDNVTNLDLISGLKNLEYLEFRGKGLINIEKLKGLKKLKSLYLDKYKLEKIESIKKLISLTHIDIFVTSENRHQVEKLKYIFI